MAKFIAKSCVVPDLSATNKADALRELAHLLFGKRKLKGVGPTLDQIVARETTESTGIGSGLAVPHARVPGLKNLICALGRSRKGIDFAAVDRRPVHLIFLICYPPNMQTTYLNFIATLARLLSDSVHLQAMLAADSVDQMLDILEGASHSFTARHEERARKVKADPRLKQLEDGHTDLILLARLQLCQEMLAATRSGKAQIRQRIANIRSLTDPRVLRHYDRLMEGRPPALVPVEGDTCQGCFMRLPSKFVQQARQDPGHIHTCPNCNRYLYVV